MATRPRVPLLRRGLSRPVLIDTTEGVPFPFVPRLTPAFESAVSAPTSCLRDAAGACGLLRTSYGNDRSGRIAAAHGALSSAHG